jgi:hypothetical protein
MIVAHLVWGGTMAGTLRELELAEREVFAGEIAPDRHPGPVRKRIGSSARELRRSAASWSSRISE